MPALYGLIGYPLSHSFSPAYFKKKFTTQDIDAVYELFPMEHIHEFPSLFEKHPDIRGLNVTIPHKVSVMPHLDEIDRMATEIGAVNCIVIRDGIRKGYNTDATGFEQSLNPLLQSQHTQALILGTGGASMAVAYALRQLGISFQKVSRNDQEGVLTYEQLTTDIISQYKLIINTTQLGMYPHIAEAPLIPYEGIDHAHLLYDLVYNPEESLFLSSGKEQGAVIKNGFEMLQLQAEAGWKIWNEGQAL
jgi:shikimate dehydrogenase